MKKEVDGAWIITPEVRWWKPSMTSILQQKWRNLHSGEEIWMDVPVIREENDSNNS